MYYRTGATSDGQLTAMEISFLANAGAYASTTLAVLNTAVTIATGSYEVPNVVVDARAVYTNAPVTAAMRGFGSNQPNYAVEMQMSKLAAALKMDPAELRRRNLYRTGSIMPTGQVLGEGIGAIRALDAAVAKANEQGEFVYHGHERPQTNKRRGVGIACGGKNIGYNLGFQDIAGAIVEAYPDHAVLKIGAVDVGQGSSTVMAQLAASKLELPLAAIEVKASDTDLVPDSGSSSASRQTYMTGNAVLRAAAEAADRLAALGPHPPEGAPSCGHQRYLLRTRDLRHGPTHRASPIGRTMPMATAARSSPSRSISRPARYVCSAPWLRTTSVRPLTLPTSKARSRVDS